MAKHGTAAMYITHKCGCDECREWNRNRQRTRRAKIVAKSKPNKPASAKKINSNAEPVYTKSARQATIIPRTKSQRVTKAKPQSASKPKPQNMGKTSAVNAYRMQSRLINKAAETYATPESIENQQGTARDINIKLFWQSLQANPNAQPFLRKIMSVAVQNRIPDTELPAYTYLICQALGIIPVERTHKISTMRRNRTLKYAAPNTQNIF